MGEMSREAVEGRIQDREANHFAMCLLMPEEMVREWMTKMDLADTKLIQRIARTFRVPDTVAAARLAQLGYLEV